MIDAAARQLTFDNVHNFRDFGGYTAGFRRLAAGKLYRSAHHAMATDADLARMAKLGIGAIVDLRRPDERGRQPSRRWQGFSGVVVENHNDDEGRGTESWDGFMSTWDMTQESFRGYILRYYERAPFMPRLIELYTRYFETLAATEGGVLVHCAAGKDRTGLIVALTHALAGVHRDDIVADYLLTNDPERFNAHGAEWAKMIGEQRGREPDLAVMRYVMGCEAEYLDRSFATIGDRHGSIEAYLRDALGVDARRREKIEARLLD